MPVPQMRVGRALRFGVLELAMFLLGVLLVRREIWQFHTTTFQIYHWQQGLLISLSALDGAITGAYASRSRNVEHRPSYRRTLLWAVPIFFTLYVGCCALCERLSVGTFAVPIMIQEGIRTAGITVIVASLFLRIWSQSSTPAALNRSTLELPVESTIQPLAQSTPEASTTEEHAGQEVPKKELVQEGVDETAAANQTAGTDLPSDSVTEGSEAPAQLSSSESLDSAKPDEPAVVAELFPRGPYKLLRYPDAAARLVGLIGLPLVFNCWLPLLALPGVVVLLKWHISDRESFRISQLGEPYLEYRKGTRNLIPFIY